MLSSSLSWELRKEKTVVSLPPSDIESLVTWRLQGDPPGDGEEPRAGLLPGIAGAVLLLAEDIYSGNSCGSKTDQKRFLGSFKLQRPGWVNPCFPGGLIRCPVAVMTAGDSARGR